MNVHDNLIIPTASATAIIGLFVAELEREQRYPRTALAMALLRLAEQLANGSDAIRGPAREAVAEEALQTWTRIVGQTDRMRRG